MNSFYYRLCLLSKFIYLSLISFNVTGNEDVLQNQIEKFSQTHNCFNECTNVLPYSLKFSIHILQNQLLSTFNNVESKRLLKEIEEREDNYLLGRSNDLSTIDFLTNRITDDTVESDQYLNALIELEEIYQILTGECNKVMKKVSIERTPTITNSLEQIANDPEYRGQLLLAISKGLFGENVNLSMLEHIDYNPETGDFAIRLNSKGLLPRKGNMERNLFIHRLAKRFGLSSKVKDIFNHRYNIEAAVTLISGNIKLLEKDCAESIRGRSYSEQNSCFTVNIITKSIDVKTGNILVQGFPQEELLITKGSEDKKKLAENLFNVITASTCLSKQSYRINQKIILEKIENSEDENVRSRKGIMRSSKLPLVFSDSSCPRTPQEY